jgi:hypothetical protein
MLRKARLALVALLIAGNFAVAPQSANATGSQIGFEFAISGVGTVQMEFANGSESCTSTEDFDWLDWDNACNFTGTVGASVTFRAIPAEGFAFVGWGGHAEGWCDLAATCGYRIPASGPRVMATFVPARVIAVIKNDRVALEFVDTHASLVGTTQSIDCASWSTACGFYASPLGHLSLRVPYGESEAYPYTIGWSDSEDDLVPSSGFWSTGPGDTPVTVSVASYRRSITLRAPADATLALVRQDEYGNIFWVGPNCIGPDTCINYVDENEYVVAVDLPEGHSSKFFDIVGCDFDAWIGNWWAYNYDHACVLEGGVTSRDISVYFSEPRTINCSVLPLTGPFGQIQTVSSFGWLENYFNDICADNYYTELNNPLKGSPSRETVLFATFGGGDQPRGGMFAGWGGACARALWNERCVIPAGLSDVNVTANFVPARILKNRTFLFKNYNTGDLLSGGSFTWEGNGYSSSKAVAVPGNGQFKFTSIIGGQVTFRLSNVNVGTMWRYTGEAYAELNAGTMPSQLWIGSGSVKEFPIKVVMDSGRPVPGATVSYVSIEPCTENVARDDDYGVAAYSWTLKPEFCKPTAITNERGDAVISVPNSGEPGQLRAVISYGDMQLTIDNFLRDSEGVYRAVVADMPYIDLESSSAEYGFGAPVTVSAVVRDREGAPLPGAIVLLGGISKTDSACALPTAKVANSDGRVLFRVCPTKNSVLTISTAVGVEAKLIVKVRTRPSQVRSITTTAGIRNASLRWKLPAEVNAGKITDYVVQYRLEGQSAWKTIVDGVSARTNVSIKGLSSGKRYQFRIAAKNKAGLGAWSSVVVIRIR